MNIWKPWHGCHKISAGCRHCYMFRGDELRGARHPSDEAHKTSMFNLPVRKDRKGNWKFPAGSHFWLCFTSDLLIEEADERRPKIWRLIRLRSDCHFTFLTKRPERLQDCLPGDWVEGYENVTIGYTIENQDRADFRLPIFLSNPMAHRCLMVEPMLGPVEISRYLASGLIDYVSAGGESGQNVRPLDFDWIEDLYKQCKENDVELHFHQTGANFIKDGRQYEIPRKLQHSQAQKAMAILKILFG